MNNFEHFETRSLDLNLLKEMYNVPSKELPTSRITEILTIVTGQTLDNVMTSTIFSNAGLSLRERTRVTPKAVTEKVKRVTKAEKVNNILELLGLTPVVNGEMTDEEYNEENKNLPNHPIEYWTDVEATNDKEDVEETEQEVQAVDEAVETAQFNRTESIYGNNGVNN